MLAVAAMRCSPQKPGLGRSRVSTDPASAFHGHRDRSRMGIYVELLIKAPMDLVWERTQEPALHERWDLRFSAITYLPRPHPDEPQRFRYVTRIGLGLEIAGDGETMGTRDLDDGSRSSALRFSSPSRLSLIREGSGYWKYIPTAEGVRFLTWYDYKPRWGAFGALIDRIAFRPILGWATAWSFDRLRLWLEEGHDPAVAARQAVIHGVARVTLAVVLAYHGLVPKLLGPHADELQMLADAGLAAAAARTVAKGLGVAELLAALVLVVGWRQRWIAWTCLLLMPLATAGVAVTSPRYLGAAFNPVSLNVAVAALASIILLAGRGIPTASTCSRRPASPAA